MSKSQYNKSKKFKALLNQNKNYFNHENQPNSLINNSKLNIKNNTYIKSMKILGETRREGKGVARPMRACVGRCKSD